MLTSKLKHKRNKAAIAILATAVGITTVAVNPTPNLEVAKQVFMTIADVAMCIMLWDIYFDEELAQKGIQAILAELCFITLISIFTAYVLAKGITGATNYLVNGFGSFGWIISGGLAGCVTVLLGMGWTFYCDDLYRNPKA